MTTPPTPGLGWYYFPDDLHYRQADAEQWLPRLTRLGARWLTLRAHPARAIPEPFISAVLAHDIEPIIHLPLPIQQPALPDLSALFRAYASWGVRHVAVFAPPNQRASWSPADWSRPGLVERFNSWLLPVLHAQQAAGLTPIYPALTQGGDYWDTAFLSASLQHLLTLRQRALLLNTVFAVQGFTFGRALDWGAGGAAAWPSGQPYQAGAEQQNSQGFRTFEWVSELIHAALHEPRPLLMLAGGATPSERPTAPADVVSGWHTTTNLEIATLVQSGALPAELLNVNFWLLAGDHPDAWYPTDSQPRPVERELLRLARAVRPAAATKPTAPPAELTTPSEPTPTPATATPTAEDSAKTAPNLRVQMHGLPQTHGNGAPHATHALNHYLLLPSFEWGGSQWHWQVIADYVARFRPTIGFSLEEAQLADAITVLWAPGAFSTEQVQSLQHSGLQVDVISAENPHTLRDLFQQLVRQGVRFQSELPDHQPA